MASEKATLVFIFFSSPASPRTLHLFGGFIRATCAVVVRKTKRRQQRVPVQLIFNLAIKLELSKTADAPGDLLLTAWTSKLGSVGAQNRRSKAGQCSSAPTCWIERLYCCDLCNLHRQVKETLKHATVLTYTGYTIHLENKFRLSIWNLLWIRLEVFYPLYSKDSFPHSTPERDKVSVSRFI